MTTERRLNPGRLAAGAALSLAGLALLGWGAGRVAAGAERERAIQLALDEDVALLTAEDLPADMPEVHLRRARMLTRDLFPPPHAEAIGAIETAIVASPLQSRPWMALARERAMQARLEQSRAALQRSDELDPVYPTGRLEAVGLWRALGDPERGIELAARIAELEPARAPEVAREMLSSGYRTADAVRAVAWQNAPAISRARVAMVFHELRASALPQLVELERQQAGGLSDGMRRVLADLLLTPLTDDNLEPVLELWGEYRQSGRALVSNTALLDSPLRRPFPLGWQEPPSDRPPDLTWQPAAGDEPAHLRVEAPRYGEGRFSWRFYRFPATSGQGVSFGIPVFIDPVRPGELTVRLYNGQQELSRDRREITGPQRETFRLVLPPGDETALHHFDLSWVPRGNRLRSDSTRIHLFGLNPAPAEPAP